MKILLISGSPRINGNTAAMVKAFEEGAKESGHEVKVFSIAGKKIGGCLGCEYCHTKGEGKCIQKDDMEEIYPALSEAEMIVLASPVYYFTLTGQLQQLIHRTYAIEIPSNVKRMALLLSSGADKVYDAAIWQYKAIVDYFKAIDDGIITAFDKQNKSEEKMEEIQRICKEIKR